MGDNSFDDEIKDKKIQEFGASLKFFLILDFWIGVPSKFIIFNFQLIFWNFKIYSSIKIYDFKIFFLISIFKI